MTTYGVILADPPWNYGNAGRKSLTHGGYNGAAANHYSSMNDQAICDLPVADMAKPDSVLLLWATWPKLDVAFRVFAAWGYSYVTGFPWIKVTGVTEDMFSGDPSFTVSYGTGFWVRGASEPLLICRRGDVAPPTGNLIGLLSPNAKHSRKPESIYDYAETLDGPYLEMFARQRRIGWEAWGDEA